MFGLEFVDGNIIQKEEWAGPLYQNIVDTVIDQISANGAIVVTGRRNQCFGADTVCRGDQYGVAEITDCFAQIKAPPKRP